MTPTDRILTALNTLLTRRERQHAPARPSIVLGRHQDGTERILRLDATCPTRSTPDNHYPGTTLLTPTLAAFHRAGSTGIGTTETLTSGTLWIEHLDPNEFHPGQTYQVTVTGRGFDTTTRLDFLDPDPEAPEGTLNPDLEVLSILHVSSEVLLLELTVAPGAHLITNAPIAFGRQ
jgi:hypothetical protein